MRDTTAVVVGAFLLSGCTFAQVMATGHAVRPVTEPPAGDGQNLGVVTGK